MRAPVGAIAGMAATDAQAQSSKAAWRFEELIDLASAAASDSVPDDPSDTGWQTILTTHIKTPNAKELVMGVSLQCGLITDTTVRSKGGELDSAAAQSRLKVRVSEHRTEVGISLHGETGDRVTEA